MISIIKNIITGTLQYINNMDSIFDVAAIIVAFGLCTYFTAITFGVVISILSAAYEEIIK